MDKQAWIKLYRIARMTVQNMVVDGGDAKTFWQTCPLIRHLALEVADTRQDHPPTPIALMRHAIKRAKIRQLQPIEVYWVIQPMRFNPNRLP